MDTISHYSVALPNTPVAYKKESTKVDSNSLTKSLMNLEQEEFDIGPNTSIHFGTGGLVHFAQEQPQTSTPNPKRNNDLSEYIKDSLEAAFIPIPPCETNSINSISTQTPTKNAIFFFPQQDNLENDGCMEYLITIERISRDDRSKHTLVKKVIGAPLVDDGDNKTGSNRSERRYCDCKGNKERFKIKNSKIISERCNEYTCENLSGVDNTSVDEKKKLSLRVPPNVTYMNQRVLDSPIKRKKKCARCICGKCTDGKKVCPLNDVVDNVLYNYCLVNSPTQTQNITGTYTSNIV